MLFKKMQALFKGIAWLLIVFLISFAALSVVLRTVLPKIEIAQTPLQKWMRKISGFDVEFSSVKGDLRFLIPSLQVQNLSLKTKKNGEILTVEKVDLHIDILASLFQKQLNFSHFTIDGLKLNLTKLPKQRKTQSISLSERLERLFLVSLNNFSISNSSVSFLSAENKNELIDIEYLKGRNILNHHSMQGVISLKGTSLNEVEVKADFTERGGLSTLDGEFYFNGQDISVIALIAPFLDPEIKITQAKINGNALIKVKRGIPYLAKVQLKNSLLAWSDKKSTSIDDMKRQMIILDKGNVFLARNEKDTWHLISDDIKFRAMDKNWMDLVVKMRFSDQGWQLNLNELDFSLATIIGQLVILPENYDKTLTELQFRGRLYDLRLAQRKGGAITYSGRIDSLSFEHWRYLPKTENLFVEFAGNGSSGKVSLSLSDTTLPYGKAFQAPLEIKKSNVDIFWINSQSDLQIWSNKLSINTPHLGVNANFLLDIPKNENPWLSLYAEASLLNAEQIWRYLPLLALHPTLTNYLSQAIQGGKADTAQILWDGKLSDFPYENHQGIFQALIPLRNAEFSFDTQWPKLTDLNIDLLFENNLLGLKASHLSTLGARGYDLSGSLKFKKNQPLRITTKIDTSGKQLRKYILATPLVDSVGAALTHVKIDGKVKGELSLLIPFNDQDISVQGTVKLKNNKVKVAAPAMTLEEVAGEIAFKNDRIWSKSIKANILKQQVDLNFQGATVDKKYVVNVETKGNWQANILKKEYEPVRIIPFTGQASWLLTVDLALQDIGFNYNVKLNADLSKIKANLPAPFDNEVFSKGRLNLKAFGDKSDVFGQFELPYIKYQAQVDISKPIALVRKSRIVIGKGELSLRPLLGNVVSINLPYIDLLKWDLLIQNHLDHLNDSSAKSVSFLPISRVNAEIKKLRISNFSFHDFSLTARRKKENFHFVLDSQELIAEALWKIKEQNLNVVAEQFFVNALPDKLKEQKVVASDRHVATKADRELIKNLPSIVINIKDLWVQGYRFGQLHMHLKKSLNKLTLSHFELKDDDNVVNIKGNWFIDKKGVNNTSIDFLFSGKDSTVLMERFAFKDGVQGAIFVTEGNIDYQSVPWAINTETLNGKSKTSLEDGYISGVGGASRILGLFSLDSIIRKLKFDFSDVFDDGLAFDKITGSVKIEQGIAIAEDIQMKALAGDMYINGIADLTNNTVNANVRFVPDLTSGLPIFTAFAVAPHAAIYVLAVTTVLSPVIDAFTQIQYKITGSIDKPTVKEVSRLRSEIEIPEQITERIRSQ